MIRLATQDKPFLPSAFTEKLQAVKLMGFEAFEIDGKILVERFDEVKHAVQQTELPVVTACGGYRGWIGDFEEERRNLAIGDINEVLASLSKLNAQGIVVPAAWGMFSKRLPPLVPPRTDVEDRYVLLDSLRQLDETARNTGTSIYLEPLNRYEDHMLNLLADAVSLIKEGSFTNVKVIADFYHMNIEEPRLDDSLIKASPYIGHVHLADSNRYEPGQGHLDFISGFKALKEIGYDGYMTFECRVLGGIEDEAYRKSVDYIRHCYRIA